MKTIPTSTSSWKSILRKILYFLLILSLLLLIAVTLTDSYKTYMLHVITFFGIMITVVAAIEMIDDYRHKARIKRFLSIVLVLLITSSCAAPRRYGDPRRASSKHRIERALARNPQNKPLPHWLRLYTGILSSVIIASAVQSK